ncbi:MAG TPA: flagellar basal body L-ring protein FlgH [Steroidobacteraceae bacterium]|nr:flagellar basal body L-ring protein FlgH [Steroidobacteraceae bacterium]
MTRFPVLRPLIVLAALALGGCGTDLLKAEKLPPAAEGPAYRAAQAAAPATDGSIYSATRSVAFFEDPRGHRVGDVITIRLQEAFNASKTASTQTQKDNSTTLSAPSFAGKLPLNGDTSLAAKRAFTGNGTATQQNALTGSITAVVTEVLPNGNLLISGERALQLNQGEEFVRVQGVVRVVDVQADNSVTSDRIADARISYNGKGVIDQSNRQGWLARFFNSPITPF